MSYMFYDNNNISSNNSNNKKYPHSYHHHLWKQQQLKAQKKPARPTSPGDVNENPDVDVEVLWLDGEEDRPIPQEGVGVSGGVAVHLGEGVEAVLALDGHLPVALVAVRGRSEEVVDALGALRSTNVIICKRCQ